MPVRVAGGFGLDHCDLNRRRAALSLLNAELHQIAGAQLAPAGQCTAMHVDIGVAGADKKTILLARVVPLHLPALTPDQRRTVNHRFFKAPRR